MASAGNAFIADGGAAPSMTAEGHVPEPLGGRGPPSRRRPAKTRRNGLLTRCVCLPTPPAWATRPDGSTCGAAASISVHCPRGLMRWFAGTLTVPGAKVERDTPASSPYGRSEEHTSELQSQSNLVCRLLLEKKKRPSK